MACFRSNRQKTGMAVLRRKTASSPPPSLDPSKTAQESTTKGSDLVSSTRQQGISKNKLPNILISVKEAQQKNGKIYQMN